MKPTFSAPIWYRDKWKIYTGSTVFAAFEFVHDDYDGAPDGNDNRCGYAETVEECKEMIDEIEEWAIVNNEIRGL